MLNVRKIKEILTNGNKWRQELKTWPKTAEPNGTTYNNSKFLERLKFAARKIKNGEAVFEKDTVLFNTKQYTWHLIALILYIKSKKENHLNVVDFGGGLGSSYNQLKDFISSNITWNIIEQQAVAVAGAAEFSSENLHFYSSIDEISGSLDIAIFSSVLQYLERPYDILEDFIKREVEYILIDRTFFSHNDSDRIFIQEVPAHIYKANIPCHFFSQSKLLNFLSESYSLEFEWNIDNETTSKKFEKGMLWKRK